MTWRHLQPWNCLHEIQKLCDLCTIKAKAYVLHNYWLTVAKHCILYTWLDRDLSFISVLTMRRYSYNWFKLKITMLECMFSSDVFLLKENINMNSCTIFTNVTKGMSAISRIMLDLHSMDCFVSQSDRTLKSHRAKHSSLAEKIVISPEDMLQRIN